MRSTISSGSSSQKIVAVLALTGPNREQCVRSLYAGQDMLVGSESTADLRTEGEGVAAMHCLIRCVRGTVSVRDLYSPSGTWVDERRVTECQIARNSIVRVGDCTVSITLSELPQTQLSMVAETSDSAVTAPIRSPATAQSFLQPGGFQPDMCETQTVLPKVVDRVTTKTEQGTPARMVPMDLRRSMPSVVTHMSDMASEIQNAPESASPVVGRIRTPEGVSEDTPAHTIRSLRSQLQQANAEIGALRDRLEFAATQNSPQDADPWQDEMMELLRSEVVELQTALAARNSDSAEPALCPSGEKDRNADTISREESERLLERLERLLLELHERDEQVGLLNHLLEAAENANRAEQEERQQFNVAVSDIENRIGRQEEEWRGERQKLTDTITRITTERDRALATVAADSTMEKNEGIQRVMHGLREDAEALRRELTQSTEVSAQLRRELDEANRKDFRQEAVQIAQERAELARMRHEIEASRLVPAKHAESDSDLRFRALREHLNEIHDKDKQRRPDVKLGSRISRLWSLLDGKKS